MPGTDRLFETIANYTYDWETWFDASGRPVWINPAVLRMTGYDVDACKAMPDYPLPVVHEDDREAVAAQLASAARGSSGNDLEFRIRHRDGSVRWGAVSWQTLRDASGAALGFRTSVRDTTERKRTQDALAAALGEAEAANRAKSRFLAAASHDLRQPLQSALLLAGALARRAHDEETAGIVESLRICLGSADELLDALLDVSRLDAGTMTPAPRAVAVADLLERLETEFAPQANERGIELHTVATSAVAFADAGMLERVLDNLVSNAVRYTRRGRVLVGVRHAGDAVRIEVHDTGPGIPATHIERVFEEFYQVENAARDRRQGLGLGLAIVRRTARLMGAEVGVRSAPGRGSVFWVRVPRASFDELAPAPPPVLADGLAGVRLAVVDDEPEVLAALRTFLGDLGAEVLAAASLDVLVERITEAGVSPDLLLVDYRLQGALNGIDVIECLRERYGAALPALLLSGDTEPGRLREARARGVRLLHKPVAPAELVRVVHETLAAARAA